MMAENVRVSYLFSLSAMKSAGKRDDNFVPDTPHANFDIKVPLKDNF